MTQKAAWRAQRPSFDDVIVCDGLLPWTAEFLPKGADLVETLARFRAAGVDHISISAGAGKDSTVDALARIGFLARALAGADDRMRIVNTRAEILECKREGLLSIALHFQTATPFIGDLDLVDGFMAAGVSRAILAYNQSNIFADGCHEPRNAGLSSAGRRLITRMDKVGMIIDLSHCGRQTALDTLEADLDRAPIFSHSNARALFDHERNVDDEVLRAAGRRGSYVGISGVGMFLGAPGPAIPEAMAAQAAHIAELIGADKVGLGLDFMLLEGSDYAFFHPSRYPNGYPAPPWDFLQPEQIEDLVSALEAKGFNEREMRGILGENYMRLAT